MKDIMDKLNICEHTDEAYSRGHWKYADTSQNNYQTKKFNEIIMN